MLEHGSEPVEPLPVLLGYEGRHFLPEWRGGVGRQELELREGRAEVDGVVDGRGDRLAIVLEEPQHVEAGRHDSALAAVLDHGALVAFRRRTTADLAKGFGRHRLDAE